MSGTLYFPSAHLRISMILFRFLLLAVALLALEGCSLFGDDYSDLAPGTFRFSANGHTYSGSAVYDPSVEFQFDQATVFLLSENNSLIQISTDDFLTAEPGDHVDPLVLASLGESYRGINGEVDLEVQSASRTAVIGRFQFRLEETGSGPIQGGDIIAMGGFNAMIADK